MKTLEELKQFFSRDRYVILSDIEIVSSCEEKAVCKVELKDKHLNAGDVAQGGLIFTLADFTFAVHANMTAFTVTQSATINYLRPPKGKTLIAEAYMVGATKSTCVYRIKVTDELGTTVAEMQAQGFKKNV